MDKDYNISPQQTPCARRQTVIQPLYLSCGNKLPSLWQ